MKKIIIGISLMASALLADSYLDYRTVATHDLNNEKIFKYQEVSELVGDGGVRHELAYGWANKKGVKIGFVGSYMPKEKEWGSGFEFEYEWKEGVGYNNRFKPYIRSYIGFGGQIKSGEFPLSTSLTKSSYVYASEEQLQQLGNTPSTGIWEEQPVFFSFLLGGGFSYDFTKNLSINAGLEFQPKYWNVAYRVKGDKDNILNSMSFRQYYYNAKIGFSYKF